MNLMSLIEETSLVLDDVFVGIEPEMMNDILDEFFKNYGIDMSELSIDEEWTVDMNNLIVDEQDELEEIRDNVMNTLLS